MNVKSKKCRDCHIVKPLSEFHTNSKMKDGYINNCKECANAKRRANNGFGNRGERKFNNHYVNNRELHYELVVSKAQGRLTEKAQGMFIKIADGMFSKFSYTNKEIGKDCYAYSVEVLFTNWYNYNSDIYTNAFSYCSELAKRGLAFEFKRQTKKRGDEDAIIMSLDTMNDGQGMFNL